MVLTESFTNSDHRITYVVQVYIIQDGIKKKLNYVDIWWRMNELSSVNVWYQLNELMDRDYLDIGITFIKKREIKGQNDSTKKFILVGTKINLFFYSSVQIHLSKKGNRNDVIHNR